MPNTREKLIELLAKYFDIGDSYAYNLTRVKTAFATGTMGFDDFEEFDEETVADIADHLIANGVTVQKWIPVSERLPENYQYALCIMQEDGDFRVLRWNYIDYMWNTGIEWFREKDVTHWMPLPKPPKGE